MTNVVRMFLFVWSSWSCFKTVISFECFHGSLLLVSLAFQDFNFLFSLFKVLVDYVNVIF